MGGDFRFLEKRSCEMVRQAISTEALPKLPCLTYSLSQDTIPAVAASSLSNRLPWGWQCVVVCWRRAAGVSEDPRREPRFPPLVGAY